MKDYVYLISILAAFATGVWLASAHYERRAAIDEAARAAAVEKMEKSYAEKLAKSVDTINTASSEYDALRAERDRLLAGLQHRPSSGTDAGDSGNAARTRIATCEKLVERLSQSAAKCGDGWQRCAAKHDALAIIAVPQNLR